MSNQKIDFRINNFHKIASLSVESIVPPPGMSANFINSFSVSPDGTSLVVGSPKQTDDWSLPRVLMVWDTRTGRQIRSWDLSCQKSAARSTDIYQVDDLDISPDGKIVVSGGCIIESWELETGKKLRRFRGGGFGFAVIISPNGQYLVTEDGGNKVVLWDLESGKKIYKKSKNILPTSLTFSPNSKYLVGIDCDCKRCVDDIQIWHLESGELVRTLNSLVGTIVPRAFSFSPSGHLLVGLGLEGLAVWDFETGEELGRLERHRNWNKPFSQHLEDVVDSVFSPDGKVLLTTGGDGKIQAWDVEALRHLYSLEGQHEYTTLGASKDMQVLVGAGNAGHSFEIWRVSR